MYIFESWLQAISDLMLSQYYKLWVFAWKLQQM